jgi:hypothetical protein
MCQRLDVALFKGGQAGPFVTVPVPCSKCDRYHHEACRGGVESGSSVGAGLDIRTDRRTHSHRFQTPVQDRASRSVMRM